MLCRTAVFQCGVCGHEVSKPNDGGNIEEPPKCPSTDCGKSWTMHLIHNYSEYNDKQLIKMQVCSCLLPLPPCTPASCHAHTVCRPKPKGIKAPLETDTPSCMPSWL